HLRRELDKKFWMGTFDWTTIQGLHLLTLLLPEANRHLLKVLLSFLSQVVSHQDKNRMSLWNVSMRVTVDGSVLPDVGLWEDVIRVQAPLHSKVSMAIKLDGQTKAKDVIARFQYENSRRKHR
ncbi:hypothetical protein NHX12_017012, partial [Muraenolepis orangiensis]